MPFMIPPENFEGVSIQILCTLLSGDDPVTLYWLKDKISMNTDSLDGTTINNVGSRTSMLAIPSVEQQHSGEYTCVASNRAGQANHSVTLNVLGTAFMNVILLPVIFCLVSFYVLPPLKHTLCPTFTTTY